MSVLISVIVPTFERDDLLANCLERLRPGAQTLAPERYEVIVSDAGRKRTSAALVQERFPWARWVAAPGLGPGPNRNRGAAEARGEWLAFVDDDCLPEPGWAEAIARGATTGGLDVIEGRTVIPDARDHPLYFAPGNWAGGNYWTCNLAVRRSAFTALQGFDPDLFEQYEDLEFAHRFQRAGCRARFFPDAVVLHPMRKLGWRGLVRQTLRLRWHMLYALKIGNVAPAEAPLWSSVLETVRGETMNRVRIAWHLFSRADRTRWRSAWFNVLWTWVTYPAMLPYLAVWDLRFRRAQRAARKSREVST